jgi:hypothetical protein
MVGRYRLEQPTSSDLADAEAWQAQDQILARPVRVTFVGGPYAQAALDAARRAALVSDGRLARVLDVGTAVVGGTERPYVISEPYTGSTLTEIVSGGLVDPQQARSIMGEAAAALDAAAQRGVHHLALRPEAVRVDGHRVVVTGLGIDAGLAGVEGVATGGAAADARDLAALAYYALTARWAGDSLDEPWVTPDTVRPLPAQQDEHGNVVALSALVPHVDAALDDLVRRTLGAGSGPAEGEAVPSTPGEVADALRPWNEVSGVLDVPDFVQPTTTAPAVPVRQSVRANGSPSRRPATGRIARAGAYGAGAAGLGAAAGAAGAAAAQGGGGAAGGAAGSTAPVPPPPPPAGYGAAPGRGGAGQPTQAFDPAATQQYGAPQYGAPAGAAYGQGAPGAPGQPAQGFATEPVPGAGPAQGLGSQGFSTQPAPRRRGVNPTPIVLGLVVVAVLVGAGWAVSRTIAPFEPPLADEPVASAPAAPSGGEASQGEEEPAEEPAPEVRPIIAEGAQVDPEGDGEKPEAVDLAIDGDPSTFWYTYTYNSPQFGGLKSGVGYEITLRETAPVTKITLTTNSEGGHVEVRQTSADNPTEGPVLASGPFAPTTELTFDEPVEGDSFVLWITEVPNSAGKTRLELDEILVQ